LARVFLRSADRGEPIAARSQLRIRRRQKARPCVLSFQVRALVAEVKRFYSPKGSIVGPLMKIRRARIADAEAACDVIRRSIIRLCRSDHQDEPAALEVWLANKTPEQIRGWIRLRENNFFVAVDEDEIVSVGCVTNEGEIMLNYVSPSARFRGVSKAMLAKLEETARRRGAESCTLRSTDTARRFYLAAGYTEETRPGEPTSPNADHFMSKPLRRRKGKTT
jgi:GNAT superfamily N-acetyltransferase